MNVISDACTLYENQFTKAPYKALISSQFCAAIAPALVMIGILLALFDLLCCTLPFAEQTFCFNLGIKCDVGNVI
jgi:hypothetical protein